MRTSKLLLQKTQDVLKITVCRHGQEGGVRQCGY